MNRREFTQASLAACAALGLGGAGRLAAQPAGSAQPDAAVAWPATPGLTRYVGEFILNTRYEEIPAEVIALGKKSILDGLGLAVAGAKAPSGPLVLEYLRGEGNCAGSYSVLGTSLKTSARSAAFANGVAMHAEDFDDTQLAGEPSRVYGLLCHPTSPVLPPTVVLTQPGRHSGRDFLLAYHLGVEVETKIAEAISPNHYIQGFHTTGTIGTFGSAAASARLLGLNLTETLRTLGIAGSEAAGVRENFGTMTKPFHAGRAAANGLFAAQLAKLGWTASEEILEAPLGFFHAAGGSYEYRPDLLLHKLGHPWTFAKPGVSIKPFPSGSLTHPAMGLMQELIRKNHLQPDEIEKVDIGVNSHNVKTLLYSDPHTGLEAKFSMQYCLAVLLVNHGQAGLAQYTTAAVQQPAVQAMVKRVHVYADARANAAGFDKMTSFLAIHLKDGRTLSGRVDFAKGSPANPMSYDEVAEKFYGCCEFAGWERSRARQVVGLVAKLETLPAASALTHLLAS